MSVKQNKTTVHRLFEDIWNQGNLDVVDELFATNFVNHDLVNPGVFDLESYKQFVAAVRTGFPDFHVTLEDMVTEEDKVATRWTVRGTHKSEYKGLPPTNKQITVTGMHFHRFAAGKMAETWWNADNLGLLQQLGVIPSERKDYSWGLPSQVTSAPGNPEENKTIVCHGAEEIWNNGNLDLVDKIFATNFVNHNPNRPEVGNLSSYKQYVANVRDAFPDFNITIEDIVAEGDKVAIRYIWSGTHKGELMGLPPTGKQVKVTGMQIFRIASGKVVENWWNSDYLGLMQQLGVIPPMGPKSNSNAS